MALLKVAVLEDNKFYLKELVDNLKRTELVNIVVAEQRSEPFFEEVKKKQPEVLLLDIHLVGESISGIQIAEILKLPVLFISAERRHYLSGIDNLKLLGTYPVEDIGKTPDTENLKTILETFIPRVREYQKTNKVSIKPKGEDEIYINPADVTFIEAIKGTGNHKLNFVNRKPIITADTTFDYFKNNGFKPNSFYQLNRQYLINIQLGFFDSEKEKVVTDFMNENGIAESFSFDVSDDKKKEVKKIFIK